MFGRVLNTLLSLVLDFFMSILITFNTFMLDVKKRLNILWKSCGVNTVRFLKYLRPFFNFMHEMVKMSRRSHWGLNNIFQVLQEIWDPGFQRRIHNSVKHLRCSWMKGVIYFSKKLHRKWVWVFEVSAFYGAFNLHYSLVIWLKSHLKSCS